MKGAAPNKPLGIHPARDKVVADIAVLDNSPRDTLTLRFFAIVDPWGLLTDQAGGKSALPTAAVASLNFSPMGICLSKVLSTQAGTCLQREKPRDYLSVAPPSVRHNGGTGPLYFLISLPFAFALNS